MEPINLVGQSVESSPKINLIGTQTGYAGQKPEVEELPAFAGLGDDLLHAINPVDHIVNMRSGLDIALGGLQQYRADDLREGADGIYINTYADEVQKKAEGLKTSGKELSEGLDAKYKMKSETGRVLRSLEQSVPSLLAGIGAAIIAGPAAGYIIGAGLGSGQVAGQKYGERRDMGDSPDKSENAMLIHGGAELAFELTGMKYFTKLFKAAKIGKSFTVEGIKNTFVEGFQEVGTGLAQGTEDSWRGQGKDPAGLSGALEYYKSGAFVKDAMLNFAGGALMSGATTLAIMKPIQMSYRPRAMEAARQIDSAIKAAEEQGSETINIGGQQVPVGDAKSKLSDLAESFELQESDYTGDVGAKVQEEQTFVGAVESLKANLGKAPQSGETQQSEEVQQAVEAQQSVEAPQTERPTYRKGTITSYGNIDSRFTDIISDVYKGIDFSPDVEIFEKDALETDFADKRKPGEVVAAMGTAIVFTHIGEGGKRSYSVVIDNKNAPDEWVFSALMHEASGHIIDYEFSKAAPAAIREATEIGFNKWLKEKDPGAFLSGDILTQVDPVKSMEGVSTKRKGENRDQWKQRMFREYKAHQISQAMQKRPEVRSVIERHWAALYGKLEKLWNAFKENYLDLANNTANMDEFVEWLYTRDDARWKDGGSEQPEADQIVNNENFNTNLDPLVKVIFDSIFEVIDSKRKIKDIWRFQRVFKDGHLGVLTRNDIKNSQFSYKEVENKTKVLKGKTVIFTIPWDHSRNLSQASARMVATNIRDMFILTEIKNPLVKKPKVANQSILLDKIRRDQAKHYANLYGMSERQAYLDLYGGKGSAFSHLQPGIKGTPTLSDEEIKKFVRYELLSGDLRGIIDNIMGAPVSSDDTTVEELSTVEEPIKDVPVNNFVGKHIDGTLKSVEKVNSLKGITTFAAFQEKVIFYLDVENKDYTELSHEGRNIVNGVIEDIWQTRTGETLSKGVHNKIMQQDHVLELHRAGIDTTMEEIELMRMAQDMGMLQSDDWIIPFEKAQKIGIPILDDYIDPLDGRHKAVIPSNKGTWHLSDKKAIGNGKIPDKWNTKRAVQLYEVWDDPQLFRIYPYLRSIEVDFYINKKSKNDAGWSNWGNRKIAINIERSSHICEKAIVHEIQHQIQGIENFAGGSSPKIMAKLQVHRKFVVDEADYLLGTLGKLQKRLGRRSLAEEAKLAEAMPDSDPAKNYIITAINLVQSEGSVESAIDLQRKELSVATKSYEAIKDLDPTQAYLRVGGEDESRRVSEMHFLSDDDVRRRLQQDKVRAYTDLPVGTKRIWTDARSGKVNISIINVPENFANDDLIYAAFEGVYADDLVVKKSKDHPAKYTKSFIPVFADILGRYEIDSVLDIFGGTGRIGLIKDFGFKGTVLANEIEPEYEGVSTADLMRKNKVDKPTIGDSKNLPYAAESIDSIVTSPVYGNEMSSQAPSRDRTYSTAAGKKLDENNAGGMRWSARYENLHKDIYREAARVLKPGAPFVLNMKDFYGHSVSRNIEVKVDEDNYVHAVDWHIKTLEDLNFRVVDKIKIPVKGLTVGGLNLRKVDHEYIVVLEKASQADDLQVRIKKAAKRPKRVRQTTGPYAEELYSAPKAKKPRKVRVKLPADIEKKREAEATFITDMNTIKQAAERRGIALSEMLEKVGLEPKDIRRSISRYHNLLSKFSQNEIIIRLAEVAGLINENTGREGLVSLVKTMFPSTESYEADSEGKQKKVIYEGSDGTLQSLTSIAKDKIINQLQTIIQARDGKTYDVDSELTLAELSGEFKQSYDRQSLLKKFIGVIAHVQSSASDFLDTTQPGRQLSYLLRRFLLTRTIMQRDYLIKLEKFGKEFVTSAEIDDLYKALIGEKEATEREGRFLALAKTINRVYGTEMESLGVKVYKKDGTFTFFKYNKDMSDTYFPRMWEPDAFRNPSEGMIQSVLDSGEASDRARAKKLIQSMGKDRIRAQKYANIEMERETNLGGFITNPIKVYSLYIQQASRRLAALKTFGAEPEVTLSQFAIRHFKDSKDMDGFTKARDLINRVLGNRVDDVLFKEHRTALTYGTLWSVGLLLQHAFIVQPGVMMNMGGVAGYKNLVQGLSKVLPALWNNESGGNNVMWAQLSGVLAFTVNRELNDIIMEEQAQIKTDKILRSFGITQIDASMRIVGAITGKIYATDLALRYMQRRDAKSYGKLKRLGITPEKLHDPNYIKSLTWLKEDLRMAALAFTEDTNFVLNPMRTPSTIVGHPLAKMFMLFKNFAFQQHRLLMGLIKDKNWTALIKILAGSLIGGQVLSLIKMLLSGDDPEKVLKRDGLVRTAWRGFMAGGGAGIFAEAIGAAVLPGGGRTTGMKLDSPVFGLLETMGRGTKSQWDISVGDGTDQDWNNIHRAYTMALQAVLITAVPDKIGIPVNAAIGMTRPLLERVVNPSDRMQKSSYFQ